MPRYTFTLALLVLSTGTIAVAKLGAPGGPRKLHYDVPDAFQAIIENKDAIAISDSDNDTIFDCLVANRTEFDYKARTSTYVWTFQGADGSSKQDVAFTVVPGPTPGTINFFSEDDPTIRETILYYFDNNCTVMDVELDGHQCILWVKPYLKDTVPQVCIDSFVDTCGVVIAPERRDLCDDGEGDY